MENSIEELVRALEEFNKEFKILLTEAKKEVQAILLDKKVSDKAIYLRVYENRVAQRTYKIINLPYTLSKYVCKLELSIKDRVIDRINDFSERAKQVKKESVFAQTMLLGGNKSNEIDELINFLKENICAQTI